LRSASRKVECARDLVEDLDRLGEPLRHPLVIAQLGIELSQLEQDRR
jgi:hypothetical protein